MMAFSASIGPRYEKLIEYLMQIGRYENRSEVLRSAMRLLEEHEFKLGYLYKEDEFKILMSVYARFEDIRREKSFPRKIEKQGSIEGLDKDIVDDVHQFVDQRIDQIGKSYADSPHARIYPISQPKINK